MINPKACFVGKETKGTIWSVDDAWFEGSADENNYIAYEIGIAIANNHTTKTNIFGIGIEYKLKWHELLEKIENREKYREKQEIKLLGDWQYFRLISQFSSSYEIRLVFCNFNYFEEAFETKINKKNNAILLDIQYDQAPPTSKRSAQYYGIEAIADLLQGQRNRADIFFVTGYPSTIKEKILENQDIPQWWIMRTLPYVNNRVSSSNLV